MGENLKPSLTPRVGIKNFWPLLTLRVGMMELEPALTLQVWNWICSCVLFVGVDFDVVDIEFCVGGVSE